MPKDAQALLGEARKDPEVVQARAAYDRAVRANLDVPPFYLDAPRGVPDLTLARESLWEVTARIVARLRAEDAGG